MSDGHEVARSAAASIAGLDGVDKVTRHAVAVHGILTANILRSPLRNARIRPTPAQQAFPESWRFQCGFRTPRIRQTYGRAAAGRSGCPWDAIPATFMGHLCGYTG